MALLRGSGFIVTGRTLNVAAAEQASALGAALHAAVAAGVYKDLDSAARKMTQPPPRKFAPRKESTAVYDKLYAEYVRAHELFGRDPNSILKRLKSIRIAAVK